METYDSAGANLHVRAVYYVLQGKPDFCRIMLVYEGAQFVDLNATDEAEMVPNWNQWSKGKGKKHQVGTERNVHGMSYRCP
eukprot:55979-Eustigmatos_ZCMA.PRE.1